MVLRQAAEKFSDMWATGKPADIGSFVESGFHEVDPLLGKETKGAEGLEHDIKGLSLVRTSTNCKAFGELGMATIVNASLAAL